MEKSSDQFTIPLTDLKIGMVLPSDVYDARSSSVLLLSRGIAVTRQLLDRLIARGVQDVSVDSRAAAVIRGGGQEKRKIAKGAPQRPAPSPTFGSAPRRGQTPIPSAEFKRELHSAKHLATGRLKLVFSSAKRNAAANGAVAKQLVNESVAHIMSDIDAYLKVALSTSESTEVYQHCLAVAQLAMSVGCAEGMPRQSVMDLGIGCILSRLGQSELARQTAEQSKPLTDLELLALKKTPARTFDILQTMNDISVGARGVAYQVFERFDGSGYPRGKSGSQISSLARLASVCDVYVALTSPRPYREAFEPYAAIELLLAETRDGKFDPLAIRSLLRTVGLFPIGSFVSISDGTIGQVVRNHQQQYDRPIIHLFFDADMNDIQASEITLDLESMPHLRIDSAVPNSLIQDMILTATPGGISTSPAPLRQLPSADLDANEAPQYIGPTAEDLLANWE